MDFAVRGKIKPLSLVLFAMKLFHDSKNKKIGYQTIFIAILVLLNVLTIGYFLYQNRKDAVRPFVNPYPMIDPSRSFIEQKYFFSTIEPLRKELKEIIAKHEKNGNRIGLYFEFLNTGANISINQDARFWPASLSKMPTALAVMKKAERGEWKLSNELVLMYEDRNDAFGTLYKKPAGTRLTIEELLKELILNSDDTAHRILIRNLEGGDFEEMLGALGMEEMYDKEYNITAKEYSRVFRTLYSSSFLNREYSSMLLGWLSGTRFNEFLGSGVPASVPFAHKIGEHDPTITYLDSGIVYVSNRPYLITAMVQVKDGEGREKAKEIMKEISSAVYEYVANN
ncbi:MAG: serine hydrolase [Candidatus Paceibacterota bacterium]|jgi:beta-lactamase class A